MPVFAGDPLTPGVGATPSAKRLALSDAPTLTKIPVLPISYGDARPLLEALGGPVAPEKWRGALPLTYHLGPGPATVRLKLAFDFSQKPIYNVIATLTGSERPDQWVIRGNHHDAWVNGAERSDQRHGRAARGSARRRRAGERRLASEADDRLRRVGWRGAGPARLDRMGRDARRRAAEESRRLHQQRLQRPRVPRYGRLAQPRDLHQRGRARRRRSADQGQHSRSSPRARHRASAVRRRSARGAGPEQSADLGAWARVPTTRRSCSTWESPH